jgi:hypothetical protein
MSHSFTIAAIGGSGPKATAVNFVKTEDGVRLWAWMSNDVASRLRPGMSIVAEQASFGRVETSYEKDGVVTELKVPKAQVFFGGSVTVAKPASEPLAPATFVFEDGVADYAQAYDAKNSLSVIDDNEPF